MYALPQIVMVGPLATFGLIFGDFLEDLGGGTEAITVINGVLGSSLSFTDDELDIFTVVISCDNWQVFRLSFTSSVYTTRAGLQRQLALESGLITNYALKTYSCRQVGLVGCLLAFVGNFLTIFANSVMYMVITFGVLQDCGTKATGEWLALASTGLLTSTTTP
uniref:Uncharacterized protein n=1 Tax=Timema tahoe TaxID=61484 RepID=A0A7R9ITK7_9NEOP|nr:unnamed protein product [Timema tahoe]